MAEASKKLTETYALLGESQLLIDNWPKRLRREIIIFTLVFGSMVPLTVVSVIQDKGPDMWREWIFWGLVLLFNLAIYYFQALRLKQSNAILARSVIVLTNTVSYWRDLAVTYREELNK